MDYSRFCIQLKQASKFSGGSMFHVERCPLSRGERGCLLGPAMFHVKHCSMTWPAIQAATRPTIVAIFLCKIVKRFRLANLLSSFRRRSPPTLHVLASGL